MGRYIITQTLIASWLYMHNCHEGCEEDAYNAFLATLNRMPSEANDAMQNGLDFEHEVYLAAAGITRSAHPKWENGITAVAERISGAQVQVWLSRELSVDGMDFVLHGVLDALKAGVISDVKFSNKSFSSADLPGKYLESPQHSAYFYLVPEAREFVYLVSDGEDLYTERYTPEGTRPFPEIVKEFIDGLKAMNLLDVYKELWAEI